MFRSDAETSSVLLFEQFKPMSLTFGPLFFALDPVSASNFLRMVGSGDSIHSRNLERPSSSGNAFTTSIALTMPIPLHSKYSH